MNIDTVRAALADIDRDRRSSRMGGRDLR